VQKGRDGREEKRRDADTVDAYYIPPPTLAERVFFFRVVRETTR